MNRNLLKLGTMIGMASMLASLGVSTDALAKNNKKKEKNRKGHSERDYRDRDDRRESRPPGWNKGRKTGWGGRDLPPGQAKKRDRYNDDDRYDDDRYERRRDRRQDRRQDRQNSRLSFSGRVTDGTNRFTRTITVVDENGASRRLSVGRDVPIYRDGQRISLHHIREGEYVQVRLARTSSGNTRVTRIDVS